jgi:uracil-DNA glycosylase
VLAPSKPVHAYWPAVRGKIAIVAQSPGKTELDEGIPLVGASGKLLRECVTRAGLDWPTYLRTNVIQYRPPSNDFSYFCGKKADVGGRDYIHPPISTGSKKYLRPEWFPELDRLKGELESFDPHVVIACGNEALWALCRVLGITKYRGAVIESVLVPGLKVIPIFHPAAALREYTYKAIIIRDLYKVAREAKFKEIRLTKRVVNVYPESPEELWDWLKRKAPNGNELMSVDIETPHGMIDCISFAPNPLECLVVPFWSDLRPDHSYWRDPEDEKEAWEFVTFVMENYYVLGQYFCALDAWYLLQTMGIATFHLTHDTMIAHQSYQPELPKDLGFLTSTYCNEIAYKNLRARGTKSAKRDE